jgi:hypothetical protein
MQYFFDKKRRETKDPIERRTLRRIQIRIRDQEDRSGRKRHRDGHRSVHRSRKVGGKNGR